MLVIELSLEKRCLQIDAVTGAIRALVRRYSEQAAFYPLEEISQWIAYQRYGFFLLTGHQPLFYSRTEHKPVSPNKSAIAAIGEACLGLVIQYLYQGRLLARPVGDYPDAACECPTDHTLYLAEAKATAAKSVDDIKSVINSELPRFIPFILAASSLDNSPNQILGLLVGTTVLSSQQLHCSISNILTKRLSTIIKAKNGIM